MNHPPVRFLHLAESLSFSGFFSISRAKRAKIQISESRHSSLVLEIMLRLRGLKFTSCDP